MVRYILYSRVVSKNIKIKIHRTVILALVLYGREALSQLNLREEHRSRVLENKTARTLF
jgi:hypothetical protein